MPKDPNDPTPKPRGRPPAKEPSTSVCVWLPTSEVDRLIRMANQKETSVSALLRQLLRNS